MTFQFGFLGPGLVTVLRPPAHPQQRENRAVTRPELPAAGSSEDLGKGVLRMKQKKILVWEEAGDGQLSTQWDSASSGFKCWLWSVNLTQLGMK